MGAKVAASAGRGTWRDGSASRRGAWSGGAPRRERMVAEASGRKLGERQESDANSASDLRHAWGRLHMDRAELEIGFGDFEHLAASRFAFSATFEIWSGRSDLSPGANAK